VRLAVALREAHDAEAALAVELRRAAERHRDEHDVHHISRTLAGWSDRHVRRLAAAAERYGVALDATIADRDDQGGGDAEPAVRLLYDLRDLHLAGARASLAWTVLGQGAQALRDRELLDLVTDCHPETIRTLKWTVQQLKEASPQILAG
jgi:hypothetical protein